MFMDYLGWLQVFAITETRRFLSNFCGRWKHNKSSFTLLFQDCCNFLQKVKFQIRMIVSWLFVLIYSNRKYNTSTNLI